MPSRLRMCTPPVRVPSTWQGGSGAGDRGREAMDGAGHIQDKERHGQTRSSPLTPPALAISLRKMSEMPRPTCSACQMPMGLSRPREDSRRHHAGITVETLDPCIIEYGADESSASEVPAGTSAWVPPPRRSPPEPRCVSPSDNSDGQNGLVFLIILRAILFFVLLVIFCVGTWWMLRVRSFV